jgi:DNA-binding transcriptional LysR family regulator
VTELESVFRPPATFDPSKLRAVFRLATTDHGQLVLLGEVDRILSRDAPLVDLYAVPYERGSFAAMRDERADVSISVFGEVPPDFGHLALWQDELVAVVRAGHPLTRGRLTARRFVEFPHVLVTPLGATPRGPIDEELAARGLSRRVARTFPTFVDAAHFVADSDYVMALPATVVRRVAPMLELCPIRAPVPMLRYTMTMVWQRRLDADPAHAWLRSVLARAARTPAPSASRVRQQLRSARS